MQRPICSSTSRFRLHGRARHGSNRRIRSKSDTGCRGCSQTAGENLGASLAHHWGVAFLNDPRATGSVAAAGLAVAFTRNVLQYHRYLWDSPSDFLISWFIHYVAVMIVLGLTYALTRGSESLLGRSEGLRRMTLEDACVFGAVLVTVASIIVLFLAHWPGVDFDEQ
jgi:hypothetical protein